MYPLTEKKDSPLTDKERDLLRSKIGQVLWISSQTRPDISYSTYQLATRLKSGTVKDSSIGVEGTRTFPLCGIFYGFSFYYILVFYEGFPHLGLRDHFFYGPVDPL